jgi:hypothetical protein
VTSVATPRGNEARRGGQVRGMGQAAIAGPVSGPVSTVTADAVDDTAA